MDKRLEIIRTVSRRRRWTIAEKVAIHDEAPQPRASTTAVADRHGISRNLVYVRRRQAREGSMPGVTVSNGTPSPFAAVRVVDRADKAPAQDAPQRLPAPVGTRRSGLVEIALSHGRMVNVEEGIDPTTVARIAGALDGARDDHGTGGRAHLSGVRRHRHAAWLRQPPV